MDASPSACAPARASTVVASSAPAIVAADIDRRATADPAAAPAASASTRPAAPLATPLVYTSPDAPALAPTNTSPDTSASALARCLRWPVTGSMAPTAGPPPAPTLADPPTPSSVASTDACLRATLPSRKSPSRRVGVALDRSADAGARGRPRRSLRRTSNRLPRAPRPGSRPQRILRLAVGCVLARGVGARAHLAGELAPGVIVALGHAERRAVGLPVFRRPAGAAAQRSVTAALPAAPELRRAAGRRCASSARPRQASTRPPAREVAGARGRPPWRFLGM